MKIIDFSWILHNAFVSELIIVESPKLDSQKLVNEAVLFKKKWNESNLLSSKRDLKRRKHLNTWLY